MARVDVAWERGYGGRGRQREELGFMYCKLFSGRPSLCVNMSYGCSALLIASMIAND